MATGSNRPTLYAMAATAAGPADRLPPALRDQLGANGLLKSARANAGSRTNGCGYLARHRNDAGKRDARNGGAQEGLFRVAKLEGSCRASTRCARAVTWSTKPWRSSTACQYSLKNVHVDHVRGVDDDRACPPRAQSPPRPHGCSRTVKCGAAGSPLLDDLVGASQQRGRYRQSECSRGP